MKPCEKMIILDGGLTFCGNNHCLLDGVSCQGERCPMWGKTNENLTVSSGMIVESLKQRIKNFKNEYENETRRIELEKALGCEKNVEFHTKTRKEILSSILTLEEFLDDILNANKMMEMH